MDNKSVSPTEGGSEQFKRVHPVKSSEAGSPSAKFKRVHVFVFGYVHGVTFRYHTAQRARHLGLVGWVKNIPEGVEALIEGEKDKVDETIEWMRHGPPGAEVKSIDIREEQYQGEFKEFKVKF